MLWLSDILASDDSEVLLGMFNIYNAIIISFTTLNGYKIKVGFSLTVLLCMNGSLVNLTQGLEVFTFLGRKNSQSLGKEGRILTHAK